VIAADTSTWIAFLEGAAGRDVELLDRALADRQVLMAEVRATLADLPLLEATDGFWRRAGELRALVLAKKRKARLGDALIAQSCLDGGVALITRDRDFRAFADAAGLDVVAGPPG
jgi:predicted nucleic acid-binding protein